ncbi:putative cell wall protein, partial [Aspergillus ruber CBS 135680]
MRSNNLLMLAGMASTALALPTDMAMDRRTVGLDIDLDVSLNLGGLLSGILGGGQDQSPAKLLDGIHAHAAAALQAGALGVKAGSVHAKARTELAAWLRADVGVHLDASLRSPLLKWATGGDGDILDVDVSAGLSVLSPHAADVAAKGGLVVTLDGILGAADIEAQVVLSASLQDKLAAFLKGSGAANLGADVKAGLHLAAGGGLVSSMNADVKAALQAYLNGPKVTLGASIKVALLAWLEGKTADGVVSLGNIPAGGLTTISVGADIGARVGADGIATAAAKAGLGAFLKADIAADLDADVKAALELLVNGKASSALDTKSRTALVKWLSGSDVSLGVELQAVVLLWLSVGVKVDISVNLGGGLIGNLLTFVLNTVTELLSSILGGVLSILTGGESLLSLSTPCDTITSESVIPIATSSEAQSVPVQTPSSVAAQPSVDVPTPRPSTPVASSTPCDTITSESVIPIATSSETPEGVEPTQAPSPSVSVDVPQTPAAASSTPCETLTSESVIPIATSSETPAPLSTPASCAGCAPRVVTVTTTVSVPVCTPT